MKNIVLNISLLILIVVGLTSCITDEVIELSRGNKIEFRVASTRGEIYGDPDDMRMPDGILVDAYKSDFQNYFFHEDFRKTDANGISYSLPDKKYYWPNVEFGKMTFFATNAHTQILDLGHELPTVQTNFKAQEGGGLLREMNITGFHQAHKAENHLDLLAAQVDGEKSQVETGTGIPLNFNHLLSLIDVQAKNDNDAYQITVAGCQIGYSNGAGDCQVIWADGLSGTKPNVVWSNHTTPAEYNLGMKYEFNGESFSLTDPRVHTLGSVPYSIMYPNGTTDLALQSKERHIMLPQQLTPWNPALGNNNLKGAYIAVKLRIDTRSAVQVFPYKKIQDSTGAYVDNPDNYQWVAVPISTKWEAGKRYTYVLDFTNGAGYSYPDGKLVFGKEFAINLTVEEWDEYWMPIFPGGSTGDEFVDPGDTDPNLQLLWKPADWYDEPLYKITLGSTEVGTVEEGDILVFKLRPIGTNVAYRALELLSGGERIFPAYENINSDYLQNGNITINTSVMEVMLSKSMAEKIRKYGLVLGGKGYTISRIFLQKRFVPSTDPSVVDLWNGRFTLDMGYKIVEGVTPTVDALKFVDAQVGDQITFTIRPYNIGGLNGSLELWSAGTCVFNGYNIITSDISSYTLTITSELLDKIKANGFTMGGKGYSLSNIEMKIAKAPIVTVLWTGNSSVNTSWAQVGAQASLAGSVFAGMKVGDSLIFHVKPYDTAQNYSFEVWSSSAIFTQYGNVGEKTLVFQLTQPIIDELKANGLRDGGYNHTLVKIEHKTY